MRDITSNIKTFFTKTYNEENTTPYAWYNTQYKKLNEDQINKLKKYCFNKKFIRCLFIVNNIEETRPQRTWGSMPEWFRPNSMFHSFHNSPVDNSFVFAIYYTAETWTYYTAEKILNSIESFPDKCEVYFYYKDKLNVNNLSDKFNFNLIIEGE